MLLPTKHEAKLIGYLSGSAAPYELIYNHRSPPRLTICGDHGNGDEEFINPCLEGMGWPPSTRPTNRNHQAWELELPAPAAERLARLGLPMLATALTAAFPKGWEKWPTPQRWGLLSGWLQADGYLRKHRAGSRRTRLRVELSTPSPYLKEQGSRLLRDLGLEHRVKPRPEPRRYPCWDLLLGAGAIELLRGSLELGPTKRAALMSIPTEQPSGGRLDRNLGKGTQTLVSRRNPKAAGLHQGGPTNRGDSLPARAL